MDTLRNYIETMFAALPNTPAARKMKKEMFENMEERFADLMAEGKSEAEAIGTIMVSFGTVEELRAALAAEVQEDARQKSFGIHIHDEESGDRVSIGFDGIHVDTLDKDGNPSEQVHIDRHGVFVKSGDQEVYPHKKKRAAMIFWAESWFLSRWLHI